MLEPYQLLIEIAAFAPVKLNVTDTCPTCPGGWRDRPGHDHHTAKKAVDFAVPRTAAGQRKMRDFARWWLQHSDYLVGAARHPARGGAGERICSEGHPYGEKEGPGQEDRGEEGRPGLVVHRESRRHARRDRRPVRGDGGRDPPAQPRDYRPERDPSRTGHPDAVTGARAFPGDKAE
jgi:hypothetical protein